MALTMSLCHADCESWNVIALFFSKKFLYNMTRFLSSLFNFLVFHDHFVCEHPFVGIPKINQVNTKNFKYHGNL